MSQLLKVRGKSLERLIPAAELQGEEEAENHTTCVCFPALGGKKKNPQRTTEKFPRGYREGENKDSLVGPATTAQQLLGFHWDPGTSLKASLE